MALTTFKHRKRIYHASHCTLSGLCSRFPCRSSHEVADSVAGLQSTFVTPNPAQPPMVPIILVAGPMEEEIHIDD